MDGLARRWRHLGLAARIVGTSLLLLLLVQLAGFAVVRSTIASNARTQIAQELVVGERVWRRVLAQNADKLQLGASVLAADFGFRAAVSSGDVETIRSALDNHGARIGAQVVAHFNPALQLQTVGEGDGTPVDADVLQRVASQMTASGEGSQIAMMGRTPHQFVLVPLRAPLVIGWVLMGFPIDQALADDVYSLINVHLAILGEPNASPMPSGGVADEGAAVLVSTLPATELSALRPQQWRSGEVTVLGQSMVTRVLALDGSQSQVRVVLLRSVDEVLAPFVRLQWVLFVITVAGLLLFALGNRWTARRITQPLFSLTRSSAQLEAGDFDTPLPELHRGDEVGTLARAFDHMRQSVAQKQAEVRRLAYWDRLTGLPNREQFRQKLMLAMTTEAAESVPVSVITLNLDRFKHVNDVLGYAFGDELLCAVADRLQGQVQRGRDTVARLGGDVFALMLYRTDAEGAQQLTQRIAHAFEEALTLSGQTVDVSASMGVASWPTDADAADLLLSRSEIAMHAAKAKAAGTLMYEPALDSSSAQNLSLLTDLRHALEHGELRLYLQPKIAVATGRVVAAEALVRWQHPTRGLVPPMQFIPFAEQTGFVRQLTLWMFEEAARHWQGLQGPGQATRIAVNLSTRDLLDNAFPERLAAVLQRHQVPTSGFCLEITESAIMDDPLRAEATLNRLAAQGFKLSIDDFGTGYSSLAYLKRLPVNELKIDKSFVMGMASDTNDEKIVRSTIDLAHNLGLSVVAEGVEDAAILTRLAHLQCDEAQGYHMSKPVPLTDFVASCERWHQQLAH
ncbi:MAG: GGDEF domain-containing protein [Polaromonas sp.]|nr:GGDEF domain-containing protein [Polaromonas sp.]